MGQNVDDYSGFLPKTTFLYYYAHPCTFIQKGHIFRSSIKEHYALRWEIFWGFLLSFPQNERKI